MTITTTTEICKCYINNTLFDDQNAGNRICEFPDFKFFWGGGGGAPPKAPLGEGALGCFKWATWPFNTSRRPF